MGNHIYLIRDDEDLEYIYGGLIIKSNTFDTDLFQERLRKMRNKLGYDDYNGVDIVKAILEKYKEYADIELVDVRESLYI